MDSCMVVTFNVFMEPGSWIRSLSRSTLFPAKRSPALGLTNDSYIYLRKLVDGPHGLIDVCIDTTIVL